jgi:AcrR family transcriptional regulator
MGRPSQPLIDPEHVVATALRLIDDRGLAAFSVRSLGAELGINGSSLYHHFKDKDAILDGVSELVFSPIDLDYDPDVGVENWLLANSIAYRRALLAHPNAISLLVDRFPLRYRLGVERVVFNHFAAQGIREEHWYAILEQVQALNFGSAYYLVRLHARAAAGSRHGRGIDPPTEEKRFEAALRALFRGLVDHYRETGAGGRAAAGSRRRARSAS